MFSFIANYFLRTSLLNLLYYEVIYEYLTAFFYKIWASV